MAQVIILIRFMKGFRIIGIFISLLIILALIFPKKALVISLIIGGKLVAPEASTILTHYCFGNGDTLNLKTDYVKESPVVLKNIATMKTGESRKVSLKQQEDWRLSYAINGFTLKKTGDGQFLIYQYIKFDSTGKVFTKLNLGFTEIVVKDNIAHTFDCTPFVVVCALNY